MGLGWHLSPLAHWLGNDARKVNVIISILNKTTRTCHTSRRRSISPLPPDMRHQTHTQTHTHTRITQGNYFRSQNVSLIKSNYPYAIFVHFLSAGPVGRKQLGDDWVCSTVCRISKWLGYSVVHLFTNSTLDWRRVKINEKEKEDKYIYRIRANSVSKGS